MSSISTTYRLFAVALCAVAAGAGVGAAETAPAEKAADTKSAVSAAGEKMKKGATSTVELRKLIDQLSKQRDTLIADHEGLVKKLKDATEEQKKAILARIEDQKKAFEEATNALHRQIRDEQRKERSAAGKR